MINVLAVAAGGAVGAVLRYGLSTGLHSWLGRSFPVGTLSVNVIGSLLIGLSYVLLVERMAVAAEWRAALMIGVLGAFTTFSAFSLETLQLLDESGAGAALLNILLNVTLCLAACWIGLSVARQI